MLRIVVSSYLEVVEHVACVVAAQLLDDDSALALNPLGIERNVVNDAANCRKGRIDDVAVVFINGQGEPIQSSVEACEGVNVSSVLHSLPLEIVNHSVSGKFLCSGRSHVLKKVSHAFLVVLFLQRADAHEQPDFECVARLTVWQDDVVQSVRQKSFHRIWRKVYTLRRGIAAECKCCKYRYQRSFHRYSFVSVTSIFSYPLA